MGWAGGAGCWSREAADRWCRARVEGYWFAGVSGCWIGEARGVPGIAAAKAVWLAKRPGGDVAGQDIPLGVATTD